MVVVRSRRVVLAGGVRPAAVCVRDGVIVAIDDHAAPRGAGGDDEIDAGDRIVMPGVVDTHVHINDPGRADWEGFETATRAAAAGGVTTLVDMPLDSIPSTTDVEALTAKRRAASGQCHVDVGFWGGVVPGNVPSLDAIAGAGVRGFKCFLSPSGVDEFPHVTEADLRQALPVLARLGLPLLVHAELPARLLEPAPGASRRSYRTWLESRPPDAEHAAIELLAGLAREYATWIHVVHVASGDAVPLLASARAAGVRLTAETCPHYLTFAAETIPDAATPFKCAPPIREQRHRDALWAALAAGALDLVATDHSPAPPAMKHLDDGDFVAAWGGIASLQLGLRAVWTAASARGIGIEVVSRWMSGAPARLAGLDGSKGTIAPGCDADLVIFDPDEESVVEPTALCHHHPVTPYAGMRLRGRICMTLLRGVVIYDEGRFPVLARGREVAAAARPSARIAP